MSCCKHPWWDRRPIMQVTCPNCGARYAVDPLAIGPTGRTVECARCHHRWRERMGGPDAPFTASSLASPAPPPKPLPNAPSLPPIDAPRPVPDFVIRPPSSHKSGLPALAEPLPKSREWLWLTGTVVLVAILASALYAWQNNILLHLPDDWRAMLGLDAVRGLLRQ
jgi:predicted Zn finger-like uncharacterized protein